MYKLDMKLRAMRNSNDDGLEESPKHHLFLLLTDRKKRSQQSARKINRRSYTSRTDYQMLRNRSSSYRHILLLCVVTLLANISVRAIIRSDSSSSSSGTSAFVIPFNEVNHRQVTSWRALPSTPSVAPSTILNPSHTTLHLLMSGRGGASSSMTAAMMQPLQQQKKEEGDVAIKHHQKSRNGSHTRTLLLTAAGLILASSLGAGKAAVAAAAATTKADPSNSGEYLHLGQRIANAIRSKTGWPDWVILMVISALPVVELRGGVPVGLWMGIPPLQTFTLACIGNFIPVPFILLALNNIPWLMEKVTPVLEKKLKDATGTKMNWQALAIFVGIPLPGTGAWTGAAIAALFKLSYFESIVGVVAGIVSAAAIMTAIVLSGIWGGVGVGVALLVSLLIQQLSKKKKDQ